jgi:hypothetical protein
LKEASDVVWMVLDAVYLVFPSWLCRPRKAKKAWLLALPGDRRALERP